ncbi:dihydroorotase [Ruminococcaceae bacterium OttesenSCG-928-O06]|nr:dihydroorotase [Ruminococcaceae bacterium OttesenSCG-928-O06]
MKRLYKGARVFNGHQLAAMDVLVEGERIAKTGEAIACPGAEVVAAEGLVLCPGFTDLHVHLRQPGFEAKETIATGTAAAAAGGFTTVCAMPNLAPTPDDLQNLAPQLQAIGQDAVVRVLPYGTLTVGQKGDCPADFAVLAGFVPGFSDDGRGVQDEEMMRRLMQAVAACGRFVAQHCEVEALLPAGGVCVQAQSAFARHHGFEGYTGESEWKMAERDIRLAAETGCRLHICHASTKETFALVRAAKQQGAPVTCEVTPHNLLFSCDDITENSGRFKMNPPLRTKQDVQAAVQALLDGTVDAIATDHAPHTAKEKAGGFAHSLNGVVGLETAFAAVYTGLVVPGTLPLESALQLFTWRPRGVLGENPQRIAPGEAADFVLLDLTTERLCEPEQFYTKGRATPFAMRRLRGWPVETVLDGKVVYRRG